MIVKGEPEIGSVIEVTVPGLIPMTYCGLVTAITPMGDDRFDVDVKVITPILEIRYGPD